MNLAICLLVGIIVGVVSMKVLLGIQTIDIDSEKRRLVFELQQKVDTSDDQEWDEFVDFVCALDDGRSKRRNTNSCSPNGGDGPASYNQRNIWGNRSAFRTDSDPFGGRCGNACCLSPKTRPSP